MFSDAYDNELALVRGKFLCVERDPWADSASDCMLKPQSVSLTWLEPRFVVPDDDAFEDEVCAIFCSAIRLTHHAPIAKTAIMLTQMPNHVWAVLYAHVSTSCSYVLPLAQLVHASVHAADDTTSAVYRIHAMPSSRLNVTELVARVSQACVQASPLSVMTDIYVQTTCGGVHDVATGTTLFQLGSLMPPSESIMTGKYCLLKPHHVAMTCNSLIPVLTASGALLGLRRINKSPLFTSLCIYMSPDAHMDEMNLKPEAYVELKTLVDAVSGSARSLALYSQRKEDAERTLYRADGPGTLFAELVSELQALTATHDVLSHVQNVMESETINPVVKAVVSQRAAIISQRRTTPAKLAATLAVRVDALRELEGVCFDLLVEQGHEGTVPVEWQQDKFYTAGDAGFVSMLYLLQWHSTVARFVGLARAAQFPSAHIPASFRTGILWQGENAHVQSCHHVDLDGTHLFLFNPARSSMLLCPEAAAAEGVEWRVDASLQTQSARARDTVVSFFIAHAVHLVAPLLLPHDPMQAALVLHGMYAGAIQDDDLRHNYRNWQKVVRELRQQVPVKKRRSP